MYRFNLIVLICCAAVLAADAQNYFVATTGDDVNFGTSWSSPFLTIQKAIDTASPGQTVAVSNGTYVLTAPLSLTKGITLRSANGASNTTIDANYTGRIMVISNSTAVLDGFTLTHGYINSSGFSGAGIFMADGAISNCIISYSSNTATQAKGIGVYMMAGVINNCVIQFNDGYGSLGGFGNGGGGGVYMVSGVITNCLIQGNRGQNLGGGVRMEGGLVVGCTVYSNAAVSGNGGGLDPVGYGGGVYMGGGVISNCNIVSNQTTCFNNNPSCGGGVYIAGTGTVVNGTVCGNINLGIQPSAKGGGIYLSGGLVVGTLVTNNAQHTQRMKICGVGAYVTDGGALSNCIIIDNHDVPDVGSCGFGGGVYIDNGSLVDCVISSNSSSASQFAAGGVTYGGGVYMTGTALVDRCIFRKNYQVRTDGAAFGYGGGVCCSNGVMRNCLIMGNTSINDAGGLYLFGGTNENCTIVRNSAVSNYGGVYWTNSPSIVNDIVYNNIGGVENDVLPVYLGLTNVTYSCAPLLTVGTGNLTNDPIFIASGSGSGTTFVEGDYRLPRGSPCLDKGLDAGWMKPGWDLVRNSRSKGLGVDMGAYEYQVELGTIIRIR